MRIGLRLMVALALLVVAGCASAGPVGPVASTDGLVWDCGWRAIP